MAKSASAKVTVSEETVQNRKDLKKVVDDTMMMKSKMGELDRALVQAKEDHAETKGQVAAVSRAKAELQAELRAELRAAIEAVRAELRAAIQQSSAATQAELARLKELTEVKREMAAQQQQMQQYEQKIAQLQHQHDGQQSSAATQAELARLKELTEVKREMAAQHQQMQQYEQKIAQLQQGPKDLHSKVQTLSEGVLAREREMQAQKKKADEHHREIDRLTNLHSKVQTLSDGALAREREIQAQKKKADEQHLEIDRLTKATTQVKELHQRIAEEHRREIAELREKGVRDLARLPVPEHLPPFQHHDEPPSKSDRKKMKLAQHHDLVSQYREDMLSSEPFIRVQALVELTALQFTEVEGQLFDRGVIVPVPISVPPEKGPQPVGPLLLGEDIFTARLLLRLGFQKERCDAAKEMVGSDPSDGGEVLSLTSGALSHRSWATDEASEESESLSFVRSEDPSEIGKVNRFEKVTGIGVPDIEEGGWAYWRVTTLWLIVCMTTLFLQLLILLVLIKAYISSKECAQHELDGLHWWLLHISRCAAMIVAGLLMTKEVMDTMNYFMVSQLLEAHVPYEVYITACLRLLLTGVVLTANVFLFLSSRDTAEIWLNMTALGFIGQLGQDVLQLAKRRIFGHHISKAVSSISYELSFGSEYPMWFMTVRQITIVVAIVVVTVFATVLFLIEDPPCDEQHIGLNGSNSSGHHFHHFHH